MEPADWHFDDAYRVIGMWWDIGDVAFLEKHLSIVKPAFDHSKREDRKSFFRETQMKVVAAREFENSHGRGSFLNTANAFVQKALQGGAQFASKAQLDNAVRMRSARTEFVADIHRFVPTDIQP